MAPLILTNAKIVTVDDQFSVQRAVAIDGARITAVGPDAAVLAHAGPGAQVIDLGGSTVIPGLIDNHNHFIRATEHAEVRLDGVPTRAAALDLLGRRAAQLGPGQWLLTLGGWHEDQWGGDRRGFTVAELDSIAGGRPAFIQAQYDHAFVNTAWLDATGVPAADATRATGRVGGGLLALNRAAAGFPAGGDLASGVRAAMAYYNSLGLTAVFDPGGVGVSDAAYATVADMAARGELTLRVFATLGDAANGTTAAAARAFAGLVRAGKPFQGDQWHDRIAVGEIYFAPFHWDHVASPPRPGAPDIAAAVEILRTAAANGWPVQTHSVTTEGIGLVLDGYAQVNEDHPVRPLRWSVTHADGITPAQLERARSLGVTLQLRSQSVIGNQGRAIAAYGAPAARRMPPLRLVQDSGLSWGLGTDGTKAAQVNPFISLYWAVTGRSLAGDQVLDETISREQALIAHTKSNAHLMFRENYLGSIRPGLLADLLVLDRDYLTIPAEQIKDIRPTATIVAGKVVHGALPPAFAQDWPG
ncbi:amidohydrolase family protein [Trebonia sp.]|uniref:amidohydrolase n=1 Tax=Trebonia sp. TaxID=2767075 RepID=UPI0026247E63|nr:amidohydrolase family protein [Trebonia sp.]